MTHTRDMFNFFLIFFIIICWAKTNGFVGHRFYYLHTSRYLVFPLCASFKRNVNITVSLTKNERREGGFMWVIPKVVGETWEGRANDSIVRIRTTLFKSIRKTFKNIFI